MKNTKEILQFVGDLLYENGVHQRETQVFDNAENEMKKLLVTYRKDIKEELIKEEITYWKDVFDNRPQERDLESDTIAQRFARIEIERWENKLKNT